MEHPLENPLIIENIFQHLDAKDAVNLSITNAPFTKEARFIDTLNKLYLKKRTTFVISYVFVYKS
jgi:hypothetical protein